MQPKLDKLNIEMIRCFLKNHPYIAPSKPSDEIEFQFIRTIGQVEVFYQLCETLARIPTQMEFSQKYLELCSDEIKKKRVDINGMSWRLKRAWATYVSECDFYCRLRDEGNFDDVIIDTKKDMGQGSDVIIVYNNREYPIHLSFETKHEKKFKKIKDKRKENVKNKALHFPLFSHEADFVGNIHLYTADHVTLLRQRLGIKKQSNLVQATLE